MAYEPIIVSNVSGVAQQIEELGYDLAIGADLELDFISNGDLIAEQALAEIQTKVNSDLFVLKQGVTTYSKADSLTIISNLFDRENASLSLIPNHAAQHQNGGTDEINVQDLSGVLADNQRADLASPEVTGILPVSKGGTGSATQNFVDLTTNQSISGVKTFTSLPVAAGTPGTNNELVNLGYLDTRIDEVAQDAFWKDPVIDFQTTPPVSPTTGDRYVVTATATGAWTGQENNIAEWNGVGWDFEIPSNGFTLVNLADGSYRKYNGTSWIFAGNAVNHNNLQGLQGGAASDYQHLTTAELGQLPTADEKAALAGTDGTPSGANAYVTNSDSRLTDARTPLAHAASHQTGGSDELDIETLPNQSTAPEVGYVLTVTAAGVHDFQAPAASGIQVGTVAPATVDGTVLWHNTNTGYQSMIMMRDQLRTKWLSIEKSVWAFGRDSASGSYLAPSGITNPGSYTSNRARLDSTIIGITARARDGLLTKELEIRVNGVAVGGAGTFSLASGVYTDNTVNIDVNANDEVSVYASATGAAVRDVTVEIHYRERDA